MKNPGPKEAKNIPRIIAHEKMRMWAGLKPGGSEGFSPPLRQLF